MKAEASAPASQAPAPAPLRNGPATPLSPLQQREAAQRFAGLIGRGDAKGAPGKPLPQAGQTGPMPGKAKDSLLDLMYGEAPELAGELGAAASAPVPKQDTQPLARDDASSAIAPTGERPAASVAPTAPTAAADPTDSAAFAQAMDRVHADQRASSETQLLLPEGRWAAQGARIAAAPDGAGVSLSLDLRQGEQHDQAATRELRRRLEARGIRVASIEANG